MRWRLLFLGVCVASGVTARSQAPAVPSSTDAPVTTLHATTRIVNVEVVVRDGAGHIVRGLPQSVFRVDENGQPQRILQFEEHSAASQARAVAAITKANTYTNVAPAAQDAPLDMVLFDLLNTSPQDQGYARKRMVDFLKSLPPHRQVALFVLGNQLRMIQGFTTEAQALVTAAQGIDTKELYRVRTPSSQVDLYEQAARMDFGVTQTGAPSNGSLLLKYSLSEDIRNMEVRLDATRRAFNELARAVNGYPGRKNLYWLAGQFPGSNYYELQTISTGVPVLSTPIGLIQDTAGQQQQFAGVNATTGLALNLFDSKTDKAIADSQIAVYPVSLVGVQIDNVGASQTGPVPGGTTIQDQFSQIASTYVEERQANRANMNDIAEKTGGEAFYGNNDPKQMLDRGFEDGDNYYTLAYQPTDRDYNGKYRAIKVALNGSGYHLSYRRGYMAFPDQPVAQNVMASFAQAMRIEAPISTMLLVGSGVPHPGANGTTIIPASLDLRGVSFDLDPATQLRKAKLELLTIAYPETHETKPVESNNMLNLQLEPADYASLLQGGGIPLSVPLKLPPGRYAVRIGLVDLHSGRIGTLTVPYVAEEPKSAPTTASP